MISFCLSGYDWSQKEKDDMITSLKELGFAIDDYGSCIFAKCFDFQINATVISEIYTGELNIHIFKGKEPEHTLLKIPQKRISAIYSL